MHLKIICFLFGKLTIFIISMLFCQMLNAQQNFQTAYVVTSQGDSIYGYIDYRNWDRNPNAVEFKRDLNSSIVKYSPLDIQSFGVLDEIYQGAIIETEISSLNLNDLDFDSELYFEIDTTFLQTMLRGKYTLFYYKNRIGKDQFYIKNGQNYEWLIYKKFVKGGEYIRNIAENKSYLGQLVTYFSDCPAVQAKLKNVDYDKASMVRIFEAYSECSGSITTFKKKTEGVITNIGFVGGVSLTNTSFSGGNSFNYLTKSDFDVSVNFIGGMYFDFLLARNNRKWSIYNEINVRNCLKISF